ncbi:uncharacterized protein [Choristoneura fumiferana]|uniref:uncharacterized protein n=1 Tax=Choristoneura fumiferana TaxID=7141 RepID=UPI003D15AB04
MQEDPNLTALRDMFASFSKEQDRRFSELKTTIIDLKEQNSELTKSVELMSDKYDEFLVRVSELEAKRKEDALRIQYLEEKLETVERKHRDTGIELRNIPKTNGETKETLCNIVVNLGKAVRTEINRSDIKDIYRLKSKDSSEPIIAELTSVLVKERVIKAVKHFNKTKPVGEKLNTTHFQFQQPAKPVFVSETLTSKAQRLFSAARAVQREYGYAFCWTSHGVVYLRKDENSPLVKISNEAKLDVIRRSS